MNRVALTHETEYDETQFPIIGSNIEVVVDFAADGVPEAARRRFFAETLRDLANQIADGAGSFTDLLEGERAPGDVMAEAASWSVPAELHMKSGKSAHRFLSAAAELATGGAPPTTQEVAEKAGMSLPPVYRYIDTDTAAGQYLAPLIRVEKRGRSYTIDVTPLGKLVAKRIKDGSLPS